MRSRSAELGNPCSVAELKLLFLSAATRRKSAEVLAKATGAPKAKRIPETSSACFQKPAYDLFSSLDSSSLLLQTCVAWTHAVRCCRPADKKKEEAVPEDKVEEGGAVAASDAPPTESYANETYAVPAAEPEPVVEEPKVRTCSSQQGSGLLLYRRITVLLFTSRLATFIAGIPLQILRSAAIQRNLHCGCTAFLSPQPCRFVY